MKKKSSLLKTKKKSTEAATNVGSGWTFLTNHTHVLLCLYEDSESRIRDVAQKVGITERMAQKIIHELEFGGYLTIEKKGRCNAYHIHTQLRLRHPLESHHSIGAVLKVIAAKQ